MKKVILAIMAFALTGGFLAFQNTHAVETPRRILIDEYYAQELTNTGKDAGIFTDRLLASGFTVDINTERLTEERLGNCDILILQNPGRTLEEEEREAILGFIRKGSGLVILGQWTRGGIGWNEPSRESFNRLVSNFGVTFDANAGDDNTNKAGCHCTPIVHMIKPHKITEGIKTIVFYWPCSLTVDENAVILATGDDDTTAVGNEIAKKGEDVVFAAATEYGKGRVVLLGSSGVFQDRWTENSEWDNLPFMLNIIDWVGENTGKGEVDFTGVIIAVLYVIIVIGIFLAVEASRKGK